MANKRRNRNSRYKNTYKTKMSFGDIVAYLVGYLLISVSLVSSIVFLVQFVEFRDGAEKLDSYVSKIEEYEDSDGDTHYNVYVDFIYNDILHEDIEVTNLDKEKSIEDKINIYYNPKYSDRVETVAGDSPGSLYLFIISILIGWCLTSSLSNEIRSIRKNRDKQTAGYR